MAFVWYAQRLPGLKYFCPDFCPESSVTEGHSRYDDDIMFQSYTSPVFSNLHNYLFHTWSNSLRGFSPQIQKHGSQIYLHNISESLITQSDYSRHMMALSLEILLWEREREREREKRDYMQENRWTRAVSISPSVWPTPPLTSFLTLRL